MHKVATRAKPTSHLTTPVELKPMRQHDAGGIQNLMRLSSLHSLGRVTPDKLCCSIDSWNPYSTTTLSRPTAVPGKVCSLAKLQNVGQKNMQRFDCQILMLDPSVVKRHENLVPEQLKQCLMHLQQQMSCLSFRTAIHFVLQLISLLAIMMTSLPPCRVCPIAVPTFYNQTPDRWAPSP